MTLEPIRRRRFSEPDRSTVQETVAQAVEKDPDLFIDRYRSLEQSLGGRYVSADLFKETFDPYGASKDARNRYNAPVHNAAAVLASEYLRRLISAPHEHARDTVILLTGIPGAGKTSSVLQAGELPTNIRAVYEGQLSNPETALAKVRQVLDAGLRPVIVAVHAMPEQALENTLQRFEDIGRGASLGVMATIQGGLPDSLQTVREHFGGEVALQIVDRRIFNEPKATEGWQYLSLLRSEGNHEHISERLHQALKSHRSAGRVGEDAYRQALGQAPGSKDPGLDTSASGRNESSGHEQGRTPENLQEVILKPTAPAATQPDPRLDSMLTTVELQQRGRERWLEYRRTRDHEQGAEKDAEKSQDHGIDRGEGSGVEEDFGL
jgi:hypothetical protein